ncbi:hypothetical protein EGW08_008197, partial [Elysia chlorotica]
QESPGYHGVAERRHQVVDERLLELGQLRISPVHVRRDGQAQARLLVFGLGRPVDVRQLDDHLSDQKSVRLERPVHAGLSSLSTALAYLGVELCQDLEVPLEVGGQDGLDDEEAEPLEFRRLQARDEVVGRVVEQQGPGRRRMVVLQHRPIIVENRL